MTILTTAAAAAVQINQGEDVVIEVDVVDQAGAIKPLAGATISFRIGTKRSNTFVFATAGYLVTDGTDGAIGAALSAAQTAAIAVKEYDMQFIATDSAGDTQVVYDARIDVDAILPAA